MHQPDESHSKKLGKSATIIIVIFLVCTMVALFITAQYFEDKNQTKNKNELIELIENRSVDSNYNIVAVNGGIWNGNQLNNVEVIFLDGLKIREVKQSKLRIVEADTQQTPRIEFIRISTKEAETVSANIIYNATLYLSTNDTELLQDINY